MNRRQFLRGAGGATLTIPFLGSLQPAFAAPSPCAPRRFVCFATPHGGIWEQYMWPDDSLLTETQDIGHTIRRGDLVATQDGNNTVLSSVLTAASSRLTPAMVQELTLLRGLDIPFYIAHHTGGFLGNYARNDGEFEGLNNLIYQPTIDQVLAWSPEFLGDTAGMIRRSVHAGDQLSWGWANPATPGGAVDPLPLEYSNQVLFDQLFGSNQPVDPTEPRRLVVDKVMESYRRLRDGAFGPGRRLSGGDRDRLDAHIERLYEVERKLGAVVDCGEPTRPNVDTSGHPGEYGYTQDLGQPIEYYQLWNEVMALGLTCGATRIGTLMAHHPLNVYGGDWHQDVAHEAWVSQVAVDRMVAGNQVFFEEIFLDMCARLDVPDCDGNTVLHNSLVFWNQESGATTHDNFSTPTIVAGSAGGELATGQYCDYRDRNDTSLSDPNNPIQAAQRPGLLYSQWLATALRACGARDQDWQIPGNPGYGQWYTERPNGVSNYVQALGNQTLPFLTP